MKKKYTKKETKAKRKKKPATVNIPHVLEFFNNI